MCMVRGVRLGSERPQTHRPRGALTKHVDLLYKVNEDDIIPRAHKAPPAVPPRRNEDALTLVDHEAHALAIVAPRPDGAHHNASERRRSDGCLRGGCGPVRAARETTPSRGFPHEIGEFVNTALPAHAPARQLKDVRDSRRPIVAIHPDLDLRQPALA
eukprot:scaffold174518_cov31-Tisochrysis_lutea.AAC.7